MKQSMILALFLGLVQLKHQPDSFLQFEGKQGNLVVRNTPYGSVLMMQDEKSWGGWKDEDDYELVQSGAKFAEVSDSDSESEDDQDKQNVMIGDDETYGDKTYFAAGDQGMTPNGVEYVRTLPEMFNEESPNKFMKNVIENFALEQKTDKGQPSGTFMMDKKQTMACSKDLVGKAKKIQGKELDEFMSQYFARTWEHFDVNNDQLLDAADMPGFQKYMLSEQGIDLDALY